MMKAIKLTMKISLMLLLTNLPLFSQQSDNWMWLNPKPQGNNLYAVDFVDNNTGYASGNFGTILKTTDNGNEWIKLNTGISDQFTLSLIHISEPTRPY